MRLAQTKKTLDAYVRCLELVGSDHAIGLRNLASILGDFPNEQMTTLIARGRGIVTNGAARRDTSGECLVNHLNLVVAVLKSASAPTAAVNDVSNLMELLSESTKSQTISVVLDKLRAAMTPETDDQHVSRYIRLLKQQTGTKDFEQSLTELAASSLKREQVVEIALSVYGGIKKSTSRKAALDYIRKPHDAYISSKRGIDATGGRSAA